MESSNHNSVHSLQQPTKQDLSNLLKHCLRPCYTYRWVAEWLFTNLTFQIIRPEYVLPPKAFEYGVNLAMQLSFPDQPLPSITGNMCYIPIANIDGITIGYCFTFSLDDEQDCGMGDDLPFKAPFIGRFAFNHREDGDMIMATCGGNPRRIGIFAGIFGKSGVHQHSFTVPSKEYTWDDLPTEPFLVIKSTGYVHSSPVSSDQSEEENNFTKPLNNSTYETNQTSETHGISETLLSAWQDLDDTNNSVDVVFSNPTACMSPLTSEISSKFDKNITQDNSVDKTINDWLKKPSQSRKRNHETNPNMDNVMSINLDHTPWMITSDGHVADGASSLGMGGSSDTSAGMFDMSKLKDSIQCIEEAVSNRPFAAGVRLDKIDEQPKMPPGVQFEFKTADQYMQSILKSNCRQVYYDVVLNISVDHRFLQPMAPKRVKKAESILAPRPSNVLLITDAPATSTVVEQVSKRNTNCACGSVACPCMAARAAQRAKILEERKKRNRMSAARSNERRKAKLKAVQEEITESHQTIQILKEKEQRIIKENDTLRAQLASR